MNYLELLPFDMLYKIYSLLNLEEQIMIGKNCTIFKLVLKQNILNTKINVGLCETNGYPKIIHIVYISNEERSIIYPFFVDKETLNIISNCIYLEEQQNLIKSILLNGIQFKDEFYLIKKKDYFNSFSLKKKLN